MMSKKTYVVPDLHGRFDLLTVALSNIEKNEPGTAIFTGDYIDLVPIQDRCSIDGRRDSDQSLRERKVHADAFPA